MKMEETFESKLIADSDAKLSAIASSWEDCSITTKPVTEATWTSSPVFNDSISGTTAGYCRLSVPGQLQDNVNHPSHYTWLKELCGIEVIDITRHLDFDLGNAIKYILRCGHKSEQGMSDIAKTIEDLKKAIWYINDKIKLLENS